MNSNDREQAAWAFQAGPRLPQELDEFEQTVACFRSGALSEAQFRAVRVPAGVYEQRESGTYMLRVRFPAGGVLAGQLWRLGETAARFGNGVLHVTTRQEFQIHRVALESIVPALRFLAEVGLSSKGGGGNTVRNITACADSGVCREQVFDVTPYAVAVTETLLADPLSLQLPRKYKISFAGCARDCGGAAVHDLGFVARHQDGTDGFAVYVAGGMGAKSRVASLLHEFIPAGDAARVAEAVKRVFDKHGDRRNKHLARLRFLVEKVGLNQFRNWYHKELDALLKSRPAPLTLRRPPRCDAPAPPQGAAQPSAHSSAFQAWLDANVTPQKQAGFHLVHIPLPLGDLPAAKAVALADAVSAQGDRALWATQSQNLDLRWVRTDELASVYLKLVALGLAEPTPAILRNLVACAGASTCRLGICLSRGLGRAVGQALRAAPLDLEWLGDFSLHISGCPNSCGRHPVANLGFSGAARRVGDQLVPFYAVQVGGRLGEARTRFGAHLGALPAKNAPAFVVDLLTAWQRSPAAADFDAFLETGGRELAAQILQRHQAIPPACQQEFARDWDSPSPFSLAGRSQGECSAGVFDLIEVDLANAREEQEAGHYYAAALAAARALLVTQRLRPASDADAFLLFHKHFIEAGLADAALSTVVQAGAQAAATENPASTFDAPPGQVAALVAAVRLLYESADASLEIKPGGR